MCVSISPSSGKVGVCLTPILARENNCVVILTAGQLFFLQKHSTKTTVAGWEMPCSLRHRRRKGLFAKWPALDFLTGGGGGGGRTQKNRVRLRHRELNQPQVQKVSQGIFRVRQPFSWGHQNKQQQLLRASELLSPESS